MVFTEGSGVPLPRNFCARYSVVACFVFCIQTGSMLLLLRSGRDTTHSRMWGPPSGRVDEGEEPDRAMQRELCEETGYVLSPEEIANRLRFIKQVRVRHSLLPDSVFYLYRLDVDREFIPTIKASEHEAYCWINPESGMAGLTTVSDFEAFLKIVSSSSH